VYYKKMAQRFGDLKLATLTISAMDVSAHKPPADLYHGGTLPLVVLYGAFHKRPSFYSGVGKVRIMIS
jgi:hypothetical protein